MEVVKNKDREFRNPTDDHDYKYAFSKKIFSTNQLFLYHEQVKPGAMASIAHHHKTIDEIVYITKGILMAYEGEVKTALSIGDSICFFANSKINHYLKNESSSIAEFLIFKPGVNTHSDNS